MLHRVRMELGGGGKVEEGGGGVEENKQLLGGKGGFKFQKGLAARFLVP